MAVPFYVPNPSRPAAEASPSTAPLSTVVSTTTTSGPMRQTPQPQTPNDSSTVQNSPLLAHVNSEYFVQAFREALCRYFRERREGSPGYSMTTPPNPSCNRHGDVFFNFNDLLHPQTDANYGSPRTPRRYRSRSLPLPHTRERLTSQGHEMTDDDDDDSDEDDSTDENYPIPATFIHDRHIHLTLRESMPEFSGRVPTRKRRKASETSQQDSNKPKESKFSWSLIALGILLIGCSFLASQ